MTDLDLPYRVGDVFVYLGVTMTCVLSESRPMVRQVGEWQGRDGQLYRREWGHKTLDSLIANSSLVSRYEYTIDHRRPKPSGGSCSLCGKPLGNYDSKHF